MAITGIDTIDGKQIIAAGAVSAKSAEMAYNDENGNPITGYLTAVPAGTMNESAFGYDASDNITGYNGSAIGGGSAPAYGYTDNGLISAIDTSGLYATSALEAKSANALVDGGRLGSDVYAVTGVGTNSTTLMILNPQTTPFGTTSGIYGPLYYAQGACMTYGSSAGSTQYFGGFFKGNEWYISNATAGQALRGETHASRGVHVSGATTAGYGFNLGINGVSGVNSRGSWKYGPAEDAALRTVSSCDMHESAFEYDANDKISGYNGSAFKAGGDVPEGVMVESGLEYNAVQEISGYNGSAIAQYGAEKQWLVHDDTLVHAANSAQYALGVNLSAVAQLLGVDETVLWSGELPMTTGSTARCSESIYNFNKIKFLYNVSADNEYQQNSNYVVETDQTSATNRISWQDGFTIGNNWYNRYYNRFTVSNGTDLTLTNANCYWGYTADAGNSLSGHAGHFYKIIGIGRKS